MTTMVTTPGTALGANDQDLPVGFAVGEYQVEALIGKGGFGTVYRGIHPLIGKQVAIKVLARKYAADEAVVSRFVAEARAVNQIRHRNIIDIFLFSQLADGRHYYVMEYLDGEPLDQYLKANGPMPLSSAIPILRAIAKALDAAHAKGIAHRDLKPENIYLARDPDGGTYPKLLDFGIAKLLAPEDDVRHKTGTGVPIGTPYYMSPEQCRGREVDHRTDVYSFGIVAYRMLTGAYPFEGEDYVDLLFKQVNEEAPPPSSKNPGLPPPVDTAIAWMMRKDRADRPPTVIEAVAALDPDHADTPPSVRPRSSDRAIATARAVTPDAFAKTTASATPPPAAAKSRRTVWIGSALVVVCSAAGMVLVLDHGSTTAPTPPTKKKPDIDYTLSQGSGRADGPDPGNGITVTQPPRPPVQVELVAITIKNVPPGTKVRVGDKDYALPGEVTLPRGAEAVVLVLHVPGYDEDKSLSVVPDKAKTIDGHIGPPRTNIGRPNTRPTDSHSVIDGDSLFGPHR